MLVILMLSVDTSISIDNPFNNNTFDKCIKNNEKNDGHETDFNYIAYHQNIYFKFVSFYLIKFYGHNCFLMYF